MAELREQTMATSHIPFTIIIDKSWCLRSHLLNTAELPSEHTGVNLTAEFKKSLSQWNLPPSNVVAIITDNGRNIVLAIQILEWQCFGCFSHTL